MIVVNRMEKQSAEILRGSPKMFYFYNHFKCFDNPFLLITKSKSCVFHL